MSVKPHHRWHEVRSHRTLIATAVTVAVVAGALALSDPSGTGRTAAPLAEPAPAASVADATDPAEPSATASLSVAASPGPDGATDAAVAAGSGGSGRVASAIAAIPDGAEPLEVDLAPAGTGTNVASGPEAAAWLQTAAPAVQDDVASNVGIGTDDLVRNFLDDPSAFLSADGMVGYIEPVANDDADLHEAPAHGHDASDTAGDHGVAGPDQGPTDAASEPVADPPPAAALGSTPADVFALHSLPSSTKVVYLDFDGHVMQNEYWNSTYSVGTYTNQPYDIDGNPSTFSATERDRIYEIWQRVADDFAPFDVDVTTADPGIDGLRRTSAGDTTFGTRTVITSSDWFALANGGQRIGGIALLNVFTSSTDHSSYVFSSNLSGGAAKVVADAAAHEAGHTFALRHDGTTIAPASGYYRGHGSWGPIMGAPYTRAVTQWSDGQYPGADNTEDDLAEIAARGGLRADDFADTSVGATTVAAGTHTGLIGVGGDVDTFRIVPAAGSTRITVTSGENATNLLARLTVRDGEGGVVAQIDPSAASGWTLTTDVAASVGTFTVAVAGTSWLTPADGFVADGSLGVYTLEVTDIAGPGSTTSTTSAPTTSTSAPTTSTTTSTTTTIAPTTSTTTSTTSAPTTSTTTTSTTSTTTPTTTSTSTTTTTTPTTTSTPTSTSTSTTSTTSSTTTTAVTTTTTTTTPSPTAPPATPTTPADPSTALGNNGLPLTAIAPQRLVDTRSALGGQARQPAGGIVRVPIAGRVGIPADARAVVANVTLVGPDAPGYATVYPCTPQVPDVSVLNYAAGQTVANNAVVTLSPAGELCVYTYAGADILVDVTGWLGTSGQSRMVPLGPTRTVDTRSGQGGSRRVAAGSTTRFDLTASLAPQSTAIALNLTAVAPATAGYLTVYPCGRGRPATSSLNFAAGETRPNNAIVATDDGSICVFSDTDADILVDVTASFGPNGLGLVPVDPVRLLDTRSTAPFAGNEIRGYSSLGTRLSPLTPRSASVNVTALDQPVAGFVTTFDCVTLRETSTLNPLPGSVSANGAVVPLLGGDRSCLMSSSGGNLIVDLNGWWVP